MLRVVKPALILALALAAVCVAPVLAQDVSIDYDKNADFSKYKTFTIELATTWGNPLGEKRVLEEFTSAFTAKGWTQAPKETASAIVLLHGATETKRNLNTFYTGGGGGYYGGYRYGGYGGGWGGSSTTTVSEYTAGTLVVDVFDAKTKELLWRGTAQDELKEKQDKRAKQLAKASEKLLKNFPPAKTTR